MSAEDLTTWPGVSVQQDLALVSLLGLTHVERNAHHFIDGMRFAPEREQQAFVAAHPDLYEKKDGRPGAAQGGGGRLGTGLARRAGFRRRRRDGFPTCDDAGHRRGDEELRADEKAALPARFDTVEAARGFHDDADSDALVADLAQRARRHHGAGRRRQDGPDAGAPGQARRAGQARDRRGALQRARRPRGAGARPASRPVAADLLDRSAARERCRRLPTSSSWPARKFGATGDVPLTWAMNVQVPAMVAEVFTDSRIVAFSTGCVYPFVPVESGGATEDTPPVPPPGDYANSCARPRAHVRVFLRRARHAGPAVPPELRHRHALRRAARRRRARCATASRSISSMGHVNVIWQGDANAVALRCLAHATTPDHADQRHRARRRIEVRWLAGGVRQAAWAEAASSPARRRRPAGSTTPRRMVKEFGPPARAAGHDDRMDGRLARPRHGHAQQAHALRGARWQVLRQHRGARCSADRSPRTAMRLAAVDRGGMEPERRRLALHAGRRAAASAASGRDGKWQASSLVLPLGQKLAWISMVLVTRERAARRRRHGPAEALHRGGAVGRRGRRPRCHRAGSADLSAAGFPRSLRDLTLALR